MKRNKFKYNKGLSLIEVLIALGILAVGILAIIGIFPSIFRLNANSWNTTEIMLITQEKMDEVLANNQYISTSAQEDYPSQIPRDAQGNPTGYRKWWGEADPGGNPNIQIIQVEVVWIESGRVKRYNLTGAVSP